MTYLNPFLAPSLIGFLDGFPAIGDFNEDGLWEPFGFLNNGDGTFTDSPSRNSFPEILRYPGRVNRDNRAVDLNGDGHLDVVWNVYSDPANENSFTLILYGDGQGNFPTYEERRDINGFGETIVAADFNNDGWSDIFVPVYTHVPGSESSYLLFNESGVLGQNRAEEWGASLSYLAGAYRVEGAQAADVNFDGNIDMYVASHLFVNDGSKFNALTLDPFLFDEGACLFDFDNDGDFDLVLRTSYPNSAPPKLFEWTGSAFVERDLGGVGDIADGVGIKVADIDLNGWQDIVFGSSAGLTTLFNDGGVFTRVDTALPVSPPDTLAFFDYNLDGKIDLLARSARNLYVYENALDTGPSLSLTLVGPNGELNQHGRSVLLSSLSDPRVQMARAVDGGSGYMGQDQYEMLIGLPAAGAYEVSIPFANVRLNFTAAAGQTITAYANGRVSIMAGTGDDGLGGSAGSDVLSGGAGDDVVSASGGDDSIDGGEGMDTVDYSSSGSGIAADLSQGMVRGSDFAHSLAGVENIVGSRFDDSFSGDDAANRFSGGRGDDIYTVGAGDVVVEAANEGIDEVCTTLASYTLTDNIERLTGTAEDSQELVGNGLNNHLTGGTGADLLRGATGDDIYVVGEGDAVVEEASEGMDEVHTALASYTLAREVERLTGTSDSGQELVGNESANRISGAGGADIFRGGIGDDVYLVGEGDVVVEEADAGIDEVRTGLASYTLGAELERLIGTSAAGQELIANEKDNFLAGADRTGADRLIGGGGNDVYVVAVYDAAIEQDGEGIDQVRTSLSIYHLPDNVENLTATGSGAAKLFGNDLSNIIVAPPGYGFAAGGSLLTGLGGDDIYYVMNSQDRIVETAGRGFDTVRTSVDFRLPGGSSIEALEASDAGGMSGISLSGDEAANRITGNDGRNGLDGGAGDDLLRGLGGNDLLNGGSGADRLQGGVGNDEYYVDNARDVVIEAAGEGTDTVRTTISYVLAAGSHVEALTTVNGYAVTAINLIGNEFAQTILGSGGNNIIDGRGGADLMAGFTGNDEYYVDNAGDAAFESAGEGTDTVRASVSHVLTAGSHIEALTTTNGYAVTAIDLTGNEFAQTIYGSGGNNVLDGRGGADRMAGFAGNDEYHVDNAGDAVVEAAGEGTDTVRASISYALVATTHVEALVAAGNGAINLSGNNFAQTLHGGRGNNVLDGRGGADVMAGFAGNDEYYVDNARDVVIEAAGEGIDTVRTTISYVLAAGSHVEALTTVNGYAVTAINLIGNEFAQTILGSGGNNIIDGRGGADLMAGFTGNDEYYVDNAGDAAFESAGEGTDTVRASVSHVLTAGSHIEALTTTNGYAVTAIDLTGNEFAQTIYGSGGNNVLDGRGGADVIAGFGGSDTFAFTSPLGGGVDRILDFAPGEDKIALDHSVFEGLAVGTLDPNAFAVGHGAVDPDDRIIYDNATGALFFDADGSGASSAVQFALLQPGLALTASDILVL